MGVIVVAKTVNTGEGQVLSSSLQILPELFHMLLVVLLVEQADPHVGPAGGL